MKVFINGEEFEPHQAKISVFDRGFLFGDAIYEVTRSYGKLFYRMEEHIDRLLASGDSMNMNLKKSRSEIIDHIYSLYKKVDQPDFYMRIQVSRGSGPIGMDIDLSPEVTEVVYFQPFTPIAPEKYATGVKIHISNRLRNSKQALDPNIKSGNYLNNVLAFKEGKSHGAEETIMVNSQGMITEGTTSNIFLIKDDTLVTPPETADILRGITRKLVLDIARESSIDVKEEFFSPEDAKSAEALFITSSTREVLPVAATSERGDYDVKHPLILQLQEGYKSKIDEYMKWAVENHPWK